MKVMIVVTHLLGTGHLARALTLGRAFAGVGEHVLVVSGGAPVPHFDSTGPMVVQLPPVRSNGTDFATLLREDDAVADAPYMARRREALLSAFADFAPDVLITELFPFGRRILREEFRALLETAQAGDDRPLVLSSIRDILAPPGKPSKAAFADDMVMQFYDAVLVHSDADLVPLQRSWPVSDMLSARLHYTGFVAPPAPDAAAAHGAILVSAGGGAVGEAVFLAACDAARFLADRQWMLLVGGDQPRRDRLSALAPANVTITPPRADFRTLLTGASASVSLCGYNTALDVLQTGVRAVLVPFDDGGEVEQGLRAEALRAQPGIAILRQNALSGDALAQALEMLDTAPRRAPRISGMDGAAQSVAIVRSLWARHRS